MVIAPQVYADDRGTFLEWFRADRLAEATGRTMPVVQANTSVSSRGAVRGIHFAEVPLGQAKYVSVPLGAIVDYIVDLRVGSSTFGRWDSVHLNSVDRRAVFVPEGFGHAFVSLEHDTVVSYLVSDVFRPDREHGVTPLDQELRLDFSAHTKAPLLLSPKDESAPTLAEALAGNLLPTWKACTERYRALSI
jgi:dTDP-4-dehydrorhamnose 3,5-epimerase